ncbi:MAG: sugar transferase, partial [Bdellovibrionaceae bacterium]|nr:sugar transferase [Pseudobdellovibrionaceae bacterium]
MSRSLKILFILLDVLIIGLSFTASYYLRHGSDIEGLAWSFKHIIGVSIILSTYYLFGAYSYSNANFKFKEVLYLLSACVCAGISIVFVSYLDRKPVEGLFGRGIFLGGMTLFWVLSSTVRSVIAKLNRKLHRQSKLLVICEAEYFENFKKDIGVHNKGENYFFLIDDFKGTNVLGGLKDISSVLNQEWTSVIVGVNPVKIQNLENALMQTRMKGTPIYSFVDYYEQKWRKIPIYNLNYTWFIFTGGFHLLRTTLRFRAKRFTDITLSLALLIITSPLMMLGIALTFLTSRGSPFFTQVRSGELSKPFSIIKLRTMRLDAEENGPQWSHKGDSRVTVVGRVLRKTRIDELPQLINVLRGDMSLIGPRPERPEFAAELSEHIPGFHRRLEVKAGITG